MPNQESNPIDITQSPATKRLLAKVEKHASHVSLKNSFRVIGISYRKEVKGIFERKQIRNASLKWAALKASTLREKARLGFGKQGILVRTGDLKKSMTVRGAKGNISEYGHTSAIYGSTLDYGNYHDNLSAPRKKMPLRNFSQPSESTYGSWLNTIGADLTGQLKKAGVKVD